MLLSQMQSLEVSCEIVKYLYDDDDDDDDDDDYIMLT